MEKQCVKCLEILPVESFSVKNKKTGNRRTVCKSCRSLAHKLWVAENSDHVRTYQAEYKRRRRSNDEEFAESSREINRRWRQNNSEYDRDRQRRYRQDNPARFAMHAANRRAAVGEAEGSFSLDEWLALCEKYGNVCLSCRATTKLTIDHVIPLSKGGTNYIENIQPLCGPCNSSKKDKQHDYRLGLGL